ncbi:uncharacterized protein PV07_02117 [Cladophialophora immunda]|uniref:Zn(2)-C6 fungal-type domain-containing protein n=1 Tax=Cladophialophora immunda TaxID=569365 RepID=A0A0D2CZM4_9EURO|nr:uncharacterized protein PV07_02117 [Cladophialophora immunda]KIW35420.1 hypothetical protein PV07_02117 [Cladophialophora immunda]
MAPRRKHRRTNIGGHQPIGHNVGVQRLDTSPSSSPCSLYNDPLPSGLPSNNNAHYSTKRAHHSKVVTGCLTCKRRHLKCDEGKPNCLRCERSSRHCDGYVARRVWIFEPSGNRSSDTSPVPAFLPGSISTEQGQDLERWSFQYFCEVTTPAMAEWTFASSAQDFWFRHVRQCVTSIPAARHLAVALAGRYRETSDLISAQPSFASEQYLQALSWLNREKDVICVDTVLLCCVLIAVYEHLDPHIKCHAGLSHLAAAFRIMNDPHTKWTPATRAIYSIAMQVETVVSIFRTPMFLPGAEPTISFDQSIPRLPKAFHDPVQIQQKFFEVFCWRFSYALRHREWNRTCSGFHQLHSLLRQWYGLVRNYILGIDGQKPTGEDLQLAKIMSVQFRMIYAALWYSIGDETPQYQHPGHANMVDLSSPDKVTVFVPVKIDPQYESRDLQLESGTRDKPIGIWPDIEIINSPGQSRYVRFTAHAGAYGQDDDVHGTKKKFHPLWYKHSPMQ